jgi:putative phosphoribosyl transferase
LRGEVDDLVCIETPRRFEAVGAFYADFRQVEDAEVSAILARFPIAPRGRP